MLQVRSRHLFSYAFLLTSVLGCQSKVDDWLRLDRSAATIAAPSPMMISRTLTATRNASIEYLDLESVVPLDITGLEISDVVTLYTDSACTTAVGTGVQTAPGTLSANATLTTNKTYTFYARVQDASGAFTPCLTTTATYKKVKGYIVSSTTTPSSDDANYNDGTCANGSGVCTVQAALSQATSDTEETLVRIPAGTYLVASQLGADMTGVNHPVTIRGASGAILDGQGTSALLQLAGTATGLGNITIERLTFQNGYRSGMFGSGGGIEIASYVGSPTNKLVIRDCVIKNNKAYHQGGGLYLNGSFVDIVRTVFDGNTLNTPSGNEGLAVYIVFASDIVFDGISVINHTLNPGSALGLVSSAASSGITIKNSSLTGNTSTRATLYLVNCEACRIENSTIANNNGAAQA